jgi:hypothetical protein
LIAAEGAEVKRFRRDRGEKIGDTLLPIHEAQICG